jgi:methionyl-tRNA formyltransferase
MRFALTATDRYLGVLNAFLDESWELIKLFTTPVDNRMHHHSAVIEAARKKGVPIQISRLTLDDLDSLARSGCDVLVVASYLWRIPDWKSRLPYCINFHPAPLPEGRGPYPAVKALLDQQPTWGVSCHKVEHDFDSGDLLATRQFPLSSGECHESLDLKIQMAMGRLATDVARNFQEYWEQALPQAGGSYYKYWSEQDRTLDFSDSVQSILRKARAFGLFECLATVNGITIFVKRVVGWEERHFCTPGTLVHTGHLSLVVAARDGFVGIVEWSLYSPDATTGSVRR